ncbi:lipase family protein [Agarilytica rhodophyticola]|uniref:lipase family protein n=1 Tax=Agarilytica rhodophyticola TaxID=1737490 RepID=UPI000B34252E|nr:Mbeg1-like protein [Agarilytica rhodophyticola]
MFIEVMRFHSLKFFASRFDNVDGFTKDAFRNTADAPRRGLINKLLTGHSLGGALAHIAYASVETDMIRRIGSKYAISFNSPRVFARKDERDAYRRAQNRFEGKFLIERRGDPVQSSPPNFYGFDFNTARRWVDSVSKTPWPHHNIDYYTQNNMMSAQIIVFVYRYIVSEH